MHAGNCVESSEGDMVRISFALLRAAGAYLAIWVREDERAADKERIVHIIDYLVDTEYSWRHSATEKI